MAAAANTARLAMVAAAVLCLLLATAPQEAAGADQGQQYLTYDKLISCKTLGNCEKYQSPEDKRPGKPANEYTRGCSKIFQCRG